MSQNQRIVQLESIQNEAKELFRKKNSDYGDAFATYGVVGVLIRLGDKIHRLQSITTKGINLVEDEKLKDTLLDLHNYAAMAIMLLDEKESLSLPLTLETETNKNETLQKWSIKGDRGFCYERQCFIDENLSKIHTCSCPSFKYCTNKTKRCKHIEREYEKV